MPHSLDCLILGGGVAGLWTLRTLLAEGYDAALVEAHALGSGQTIASQAILHAGTKYALTGQAAEASKAVGEAAAIWRTQLSDAPSPQHPDLSPTTVLSRHTCMFTTPGIGSRLTGLAASKALVSGPEKLARADWPAGFDAAPRGVDLYQLDEPVLDLPSLLETLSAPAVEQLIHAETVSLQWGQSGDTGERTVSCALTTSLDPITIEPRALVCSAGAGAADLLAQLGLESGIPMQRRPLHMVLARGRDLPPVYAHCVSLSDKPRATITTTTDRQGRTVWYIGGQLAESGVERTREAQIEAARKELRHIVPWVDIATLEFATHRVDRAEGLTPGGKRPDTPVVRREGPVIACWPTKLVLAPIAAGMVRQEFGSLGIEPGTAGKPLPTAPRPPIATPLWEREDLPWA